MALTCGWIMLCKQCGFGLGNQANFCPGCGEKVLEEDRQEGFTQKQPAKWLKLLFGLILAGLTAGLLMMLFSDNMSDTVSEQLKAIKEDRLKEAYYNYTSKEFQAATSFNSFEEFLINYPAFSQSKSIRFIDRHAESDSGVLKAMISNDEGTEYPVRYQLVKSEDKWLISSIKLEEFSRKTLAITENDLKQKKEIIFNSQPLKDAITGMMLQVREHNIKDAYESYTSADFRKTTTLDEFEGFIKQNPAFSQNESVELNELSFDNNVATMNGTLKDTQGNLYSAEYDLVEERGKWKIFHAKVWALDPRNHEDAAKLSFSKFILGSEVDGNNIVTNPKTIFKGSDGDIYLNLSADNVKAGTKIEVVFEHVDTHSKITPVSKRILENGDMILSFIFSPPEKGWPVGNYRILAAASSGEKESYDFKMEE